MHVMEWTMDLFSFFFFASFMLYKSTNTFNSDSPDVLAFLLVILLCSTLLVDCHCMFASCRFLILWLFFFFWYLFFPISPYCGLFFLGFLLLSAYALDIVSL
ncbi:unnamed protein product [Rhizopus stolonifer]